MSYISTQGMRIKGAVQRDIFWAEMFIIIPLALLGIWWPVIFEWTGYVDYFAPAVWFTFGLGSLCTIFIRRSILPDEKDDFKVVNTIVIAIFCLVAAILYGKALITVIKGRQLDDVLLCFDVLEMAIGLHLFVWIWSFISISDFDENSPGNSLGGSYD